MDQASRLRNISKMKRASDEYPKSVRRIAVTSGKGGVGKSNFSLNLAICFQQFKKQTLLIDADTNLANIDILLGISPEFSLVDVILGNKFISDILLEGPDGLTILPAGSGVIEMIGLDGVIQEHIEQSMRELEKNQDFIIMDTGAGISDIVIDFACEADDVIVITTPEPTAITDAYAAIKVMASSNPKIKYYLVVNMVKNQTEADEVARKIRLVVENYLALNIEYLGFLPRDEYIPKCVARQQPFIQVHPKGPASVQLMTIAKRLLKRPSTTVNSKSLFNYLKKRERIRG